MIVLLLAMCATPAMAQVEEALFRVRGQYFRYGFFGRGASGLPAAPPAFGPIDAPFQLPAAFPGATANRSITTQINAATGGRNQLTVSLLNETLLRAARLDGNDWGGGVDLVVDVYIKGPPGTSYVVTKILTGQVTALHGGGLGTTQAYGDAATALWNNSTGAQSIPSTGASEWTGVTSSVAHPFRWGYHFARSVPISVWGFAFQNIDFCFPGCPQLLNFRATSDVAVTIDAICTGSPCPLDAATADWNVGGVQKSNNCYNYATNNRGGCPAQPGAGGGTPLPIVFEDRDCWSPGAAFTCESVAAAARADGLMGPFQSADHCPPGSCLVYLVINPDTFRGSSGCCVRDHHWFRRNADGQWSDKIGWAPATNRGPQPQFTSECYPVPCGYFCVPCDARVRAPVEPCPPESPSEPTGELDVGSGGEGPTFPITDPVDIQGLVDAIAAGTLLAPPSTPPSYGFRGFILRGAAGNVTLPRFARFTSEAMFVVDGSGSRYLRDNAGAYGVMRRLAIRAGWGRYVCGCIADVDDGGGTGACDGGVTIEDLLFYLVLFADGVVAADIDDGSGTGRRDGGVTIEDLLYYLDRFAAGC